jgi:hypothetical protein
MATHCLTLGSSVKLRHFLEKLKIIKYYTIRGKKCAHSSHTGDFGYHLDCSAAHAYAHARCPHPPLLSVMLDGSVELRLELQSLYLCDQIFSLYF